MLNTLKSAQNLWLLIHFLIDFVYNYAPIEIQVSVFIVTAIKKLLRKKSKKTAVHSDFIIPRSKHHVSKTEIPDNALNVLNRLNSSGFDAYLVGGGVRDLLLRKKPKDFDVVTSATPNQIKRLFKNARIIGRRFKLVHVGYGRDIIEVATFRGHDSVSKSEQSINDKGMIVRDNTFGNLEQDAWRRDFTLNSLYYDIQNATIVDYTGGFKDLQSQTLKMIGDPALRYQEDPVRALRAIRFSAKLNLKIEAETAQPLHHAAALLEHVSSARLFDEFTKLYHCGNAKQVQSDLIQYGLFEAFFSQTHHFLNTAYPASELIDLALENTDSRISQDKPVIPAFFFAVILWFPFIALKAEIEESDSEIDPIEALEQAMSRVLKLQCTKIAIPKRHTQIIREIWLFQFRLEKRTGRRAETMLGHPRFRAAYDFLSLRALAGDAPIKLADWWTQYQESSRGQRQNMVNKLNKKPKKK